MDSNDESREYTAHACDSCYKRKIKCDAAVSQCNWCSHHGLHCTFERGVRRKRKIEYDGTWPNASRLLDGLIEQPLMEHLTWGQRPVPADLSQILNSSSNSSGSTSISTSNRPLLLTLVDIPFAGRELGVISFLRGISFLQPESQNWIQASTEQTPSGDKKDRARSCNALSMNLPSQNLSKLPDWRLVRLYFDAYKNSVMQRIFPVVNSDLFEETIHTAYSHPQSNFSLEKASSRACIIAFLAFASRILPSVKNHIRFSPVNKDALAAECQFLLPRVLQEPADLDGAQAVTMLTLCELFSGNMRATNYLVAIAARQLFMLGANLTSYRASSQSERGQKRQQQLRNLFWICYTLDKDVSLRTGQPPTLPDENCNLSLPPGYLNRVFSDPVKDDNRYKDYLKMAPVIMERIFVQKLPENDVVQFKRLVEFVTELKQLAECAINKAWYVPSARSHLPQ